ncbi:polyhydroxyalkanoate depolymerase [Sulfitobacter aestuariivivens]|uniref:Polyhydroxyalkanoate depolymerase n=1 Tax=Sulfitobacter aestuariivivens TaxID=2766981 RepID=A0A927HF18_9RHOB|nr:polyhydroxyalkanoate depolymerase [Sulfitobacter aestuariivivens]MBD3662770.1 polyhydroxyalkanoate depolymerase [Sulfitobacter aestuariivivens]
MRYMATYDMMETIRNTNQFLGASALAMASYPAFAMFPNPAMQWLAAWGEVTERTFSRMVMKPDWNIPPFVGSNGQDRLVSVEKEIARDFGDLIHFKVQGRTEPKRKVLLVAPMSGHYATLLRSTVISLLPDCDLYVTDWHNARDIPVSAGKFDVEDYTLYLVDFMKHLGPETHVIAVCQPAPLTLAATAYLAEEDPKAQPRSLTLIGGPIDPDATPTEVTDFGRRVTMGQLEEMMIQRVGFKYAGVGRMVYPGLLQLASFISMNSETHTEAFQNQITRVAQGEAHEHDKHNKFYDEYLAVMDMTAEFYLSTVERIFKNGEIAKNAFVVGGRHVDIGKITTVAVKTVEGSNDDISAPGQCVAALDLLTGLPDSKKASHLEEGAGHYGIFAGRSWRNNIRPLVLDFIDANTPGKKPHRKRGPHQPDPANYNVAV